jgi:hypothetical protein
MLNMYFIVLREILAVFLQFFIYPPSIFLLSEITMIFKFIFQLTHALLFFTFFSVFEVG